MSDIVSMTYGFYLMALGFAFFVGGCLGFAIGVLLERVL